MIWSCWKRRPLNWRCSLFLFRRMSYFLRRTEKEEGCTDVSCGISSTHVWSGNSKQGRYRGFRRRAWSARALYTCNSICPDTCAPSPLPPNWLWTSAWIVGPPVMRIIPTTFQTKAVLSFFLFLLLRVGAIGGDIELFIVLWEGTHFLNPNFASIKTCFVSVFILLPILSPCITKEYR